MVGFVNHLLLMPNQLVVSLEFQVAFLTLVTKTWCPSEPALHIIIHHALVRRLIFISFPRLLSGILKPDNDNSWS